MASRSQYTELVLLPVRSAIIKLNRRYAKLSCLEWPRARADGLGFSAYTLLKHGNSAEERELKWAEPGYAYTN